MDCLRIGVHELAHCGDPFRQPRALVEQLRRGEERRQGHRFRRTRQLLHEGGVECAVFGVDVRQCLRLREAESGVGGVEAGEGHSARVRIIGVEAAGDVRHRAGIGHRMGEDAYAIE